MSDDEPWVYTPSPGQEGSTAAGNREPLSACPYAPGSDEGKEWIQSWTALMQFVKHADGEMGTTAADRFAAGLPADSERVRGAGYGEDEFGEEWKVPEPTAAHLHLKGSPRGDHLHANATVVDPSAGADQDQ